MTTPSPNTFENKRLLAQIKSRVKLIVIGVSYGGINAMRTIFPVLPQDFSLPVVVVQHVGQHSGTSLSSYLSNICKISIKEAEEKEELKAGVVYFAPSNYHLLVEDTMTLSLSVENRVNYSRPAIDVLFESAAYALGDKVFGVVLTGANSDGSIGLKRIKENGGWALVQSPETSEATAMPQGAIDAVNVDCILPLDEIGPFLVKLFGSNEEIGRF